MSLFLLLWIAALFPIAGLAQGDLVFECPGLEDPYEQIPSQRGGRYFTEQGMVRGLVVFVQFTGDNTDPANTTWPVNQPPTYLREVLDSTLTPQTADSGSLSHNFREMSFSKLRVYGKAYFVITDSTKQWYQSQGKNYGDVNKDVLIKLDSQINYSLYDNWTFGTNYNHENKPDGIVDLIIMVYRENLENSIHPGSGIARLGFSGYLYVETGNIRINGNFPGSGVSLEKGMWGRRTDWYAHEIGHLLFGAGHSGYNKEPSGFGNPAFWGLTIGTGYLINAYERHWLRWVDYADLDIADSLDISVSDYLTSGDAYRIALPGAANEAFFIENHQELSYFDEWVNRNGPGKGLYIYHVQGSSSHPRYDMEIAEGRFDWLNPFWILNPWGSGQPGDSIPVFVQDKPNRKGYDGWDAVPHSKGGIFKIYATDNDRNGQWEQNWRVYGSELDAFKVGYNQIFSPWSNPNSNLWNDQDTGLTPYKLE